MSTRGRFGRGFPRLIGVFQNWTPILLGRVGSMFSCPISTHNASRLSWILRAHFYSNSNLYSLRYSLPHQLHVLFVRITYFSTQEKAVFLTYILTQSCSSKVQPKRDWVSPSSTVGYPAHQRVIHVLRGFVKGKKGDCGFYSDVHFSIFQDDEPKQQQRLSCLCG